jgi:hypothetical protein
MRRRSSREIVHRLRQEARNLQLAAMPPPLPRGFDVPSPLAQLPDPASVAPALHDTAYAQQVASLAEQIRAHNFPLLGLTLNTDSDIRWRRDYLSSRETGPDYFRRIPYLDPQLAGDHKVIWELNRHQHLVLLAQAYLLTGNAANLDEIIAQLESWFGQNPFQRGINWASALEVAFRALSWTWIYHLTGTCFAPAFRERFLQQLYWHGLHLENNLSFYFSPNTHLLGEAVALHALGVLFPSFPRAAKWKQLGAAVTRKQMHLQVQDDGSHFEHSTYYHVYALDMLLFHSRLDPPSPGYRSKLERMAEFLHCVMGPSGVLPFFGDDDGGRFFHPFGPRERFGRATLGTSAIVLSRLDWLRDSSDLHEQGAWWLGPSALTAVPKSAVWQSHFFENVGLAVMIAQESQAIVDAGRFGPWSSGHSHSDALHLTARCGNDEILVDPGTYTYVSDARSRDWFRGSSAHNTIRIDGRDQAVPLGPFGWRDQPKVQVYQWQTNAEADLIEATCDSGLFTHRRRVRFVKPDLLLIVDDVRGPAGDHEVEQFWHFGSAEATNCLVTTDTPEAIDSWRSLAPGDKYTIPALRVKRNGPLPQRFAAAILLNHGISVLIRSEEKKVVFEWTRSDDQSPLLFQFTD